MRRALPAALALVLPSLVAAQNVSMTPSFAASELYDDNLFVSASDPQPSLVHRFGPRLQVEHSSAPLSLIGRYELDAEYLQALPDQGLQFAHQLGTFKLRHRTMKHLTLEADAAYVDTRAPVELRSVTALDRGRIRARRFSVGPSAHYEIDRRTRSEAGYLFARDLVLGSTTDTHIATAEIAHRFTRTDTGSAGLIVRELVFDGDALEPSEVVLLGWTRRFARRTSASVHAGPRFRSEEPEGVEADATLRHGFARAELEASYTRAETTAIGLPGSLQTDAGALTATLRIEPSVLRTSAGFARTHGTALQADVFHTLIEATTQVHPWLSLQLSLTCTWQQLQTAPIASVAGATSLGGSSEVFHDIVALTLVVAPPEPYEL